MIRKITFLGLIMLLFTSINSFATFVNIETAGDVAENFYRNQYFKNFGSIPQFSAKTINAKWTENRIVYYICNFSHGGFVIVSADDNAFPVIGYSFEENFPENQISPAFENWMKNIESQIIMASEKKEKSQYSSVWDKYLSDNPSDLYNKGQFKSVSPLLTLRWDQGDPYNLQCPASVAGPGGHCLTGCVATAMAQIMKYWNYPERGRDSILYTGNNNLVFENTYYNWDAMTNYANTSSPDSTKNAIAELMFHCGVTVNMMYGPNGSGTFTELVPYALIHYFRYHPSAGYILRKNVTDIEWDLMIRDNLDNGMPVLYSGEGTGGHAFVCDGYNDTCYYHFNWGWSGAANGYYYNNDLTPMGDDFSQGQGAVFNIMPYFAPYCREGRVLTDQARSFNDGSSHSYYWNNTQCDWLISPDSAAKITLSFASFSTEANADFVSVYDGADSTSPLLGKFSGDQLPPALVSSAGKMYIVFTSNESVQSFGWEAWYDASSVNVPEINFENSLSFYPNPAKDDIYFKTGNGKKWNGVIGIYNITGELLLSKEVHLENPASSVIAVSELPKGFYLLKAKNNEGEFVQRFVKE